MLGCYLIEIMEYFGKFYHSKKITVLETETQSIGPVGKQEPLNL